MEVQRIDFNMKYGRKLLVNGQATGTLGGVESMLGHALSTQLTF